MTSGQVEREKKEDKAELHVCVSDECEAPPGEPNDRDQWNRSHTAHRQ